MFNSEKNVIYLDMDDVLADFSAEVIAVIGHTVDNLSSSSGKAHIWDELKKKPHFFLHLRPLPYAKELYELAASLGKNVEILTAIPEKWADQEEIKKDKTAWAHKHISAGIRVNFGPRSWDKWKHAQPGDVLVDDSKLNIDDWTTKTEGIGIHHDPRDVARTKKLLKELVNKQ